MSKEEARAAAIDRRNELVRTVGGQILDLIQGGQIGTEGARWTQNPKYALPFNPVTGHRYSGFNLITLMLSGRSDPRFMSFDQILTLQQKNPDIHLEKGSVGVRILRPVLINKTPDSNPDQAASPETAAGEEQAGAPPKEPEKRMFFKIYTVFSADQIRGMPPLEASEPRNWEDDPLIEKFFKASGMQVVHGSNRAFYSPSLDETTLPEPDQFRSKEAYYATAMHEWFHWTGHESREDRLVATHKGSEDYAIEELRAEVFSALAGRALGLPFDLGEHAHYIQSWNAKLASDPENVIKAAVQAGKMLEVVLDFANGLQPEPKWFPKLDLHLDEGGGVESDPDDGYEPLFG